MEAGVRLPPRGPARPPPQGRRPPRPLEARGRQHAPLGGLRPGGDPRVGRGAVREARDPPPPRQGDERRPRSWRAPRAARSTSRRRSRGAPSRSATPSSTRAAERPRELHCDDRIAKPRAGHAALDPRGAEAQTDFTVLERVGEFDLVEARPRTGRTHQVRLHAARLDMPILGDVTYGGARAAPAPSSTRARSARGARRPPREDRGPASRELPRRGISPAGVPPPRRPGGPRGEEPPPRRTRTVTGGSTGRRTRCATSASSGWATWRSSSRDTKARRCPASSSRRSSSTGPRPWSSGRAPRTRARARPRT